MKIKKLKKVNKWQFFSIAVIAIIIILSAGAIGFKAGGVAFAADTISDTVLDIVQNDNNVTVQNIPENFTVAGENKTIKVDVIYFLNVAELNTMADINYFLSKNAGNYTVKEYYSSTTALNSTFEFNAYDFLLNQNVVSNNYGFLVRFKAVVGTAQGANTFISYSKGFRCDYTVKATASNGCLKISGLENNGMYNTDDRNVTVDLFYRAGTHNYTSSELVNAIDSNVFTKLSIPENLWPSFNGLRFNDGGIILLSKLMTEKSLSAGDYTVAVRFTANDDNATYKRYSNIVHYTLPQLSQIDVAYSGYQDVDAYGDTVNARTWTISTNDITTAYITATGTYGSADSDLSGKNFTAYLYYDDSYASMECFNNEKIASNGRSYIGFLAFSTAEKGTYTLAMPNGIGYAEPDSVNLSFMGEKFVPSVELPEEPIKEGYTFIGWYYDSDFVNPYQEGDIITEDTELFAKFDKNKYNINYFVNNVLVQTKVVEYEAKAENIKLSETGYKFSCWSLDTDGVAAYDFENNTVSDNLNLYATKSIIMLKVTFKIGNEVYSVLNVPYGSTLVETARASGCADICTAFLLNGAPLNAETVLTDSIEIEAQLSDKLGGWLKFGMWWVNNWKWVVIGLACAIVVAVIVIVIYKRA